MVKLLRVHKKELLVLLVISVVYFAVRLPNLTLQPVFADEAIYIRWAQLIRVDPGLRFIPLSDGKTPLFMWLMTPFLKIFADPLFAGRFLSVLSGFMILLGVVFLAGRFFNKRVAVMAALLIATTPFFVFFNRMALVDSMLAAFTIWALYIALCLIKFPRIDLAMLLGYLYGGAMLTKTPALFNILTLPATLITFNFSLGNRPKRIFNLIGLWVFALTITFVMYNILRLGQGFSNLGSRNQDYVLSISRILERPDR